MRSRSSSTPRAVSSLEQQLNALRDQLRVQHSRHERDLLGLKADHEQLKEFLAGVDG